jgi:TonB family protein
VAATAPQADVRVCADESGKLTRDPVITHSSGDAGLDAAALGVARSGAAYYRPAGAAGVSGCVDIAVRFEPK